MLISKDSTEHMVYWLQSKGSETGNRFYDQVADRLRQLELLEEKLRTQNDT